MAICDIPVISNVCDAAGEAAAALVSAPFDWLAQAMGQAAGWLFEAVWSVFDTTTDSPRRVRRASFWCQAAVSNGWWRA